MPIASFSYDEINLTCNVYSKFYDDGKLRDINFNPRAKISISLRTSKDGMAAIINGPSDSVYKYSRIIMGLNMNTEEHIVKGETNSTDKNYSIISEDRRKKDGFIRIDSLEINRTTGNITLIEDSKSQKFYVSSEGQCSVIQSKPKF